MHAIAYLYCGVWFLTSLLLRCFEHGKAGTRSFRYNAISNHNNNQMDDQEVIRSISSMKAQQIKQLLAAEKIGTNGMYDKAEFVQRMLEYERSMSASCTVVPLLVFSFANDKKRYYGLEGSCKGFKLKLLLDTASTCSILAKNAVQRLGLPTQPVSHPTKSLGGNGRLFSSKVRMSDFKLGNRSFDIECLVNGNAGSLPADCDGLLGLDFFMQLRSDVMFDFQQRKLKIGELKNIIPCAHRAQFERVPLLLDKLKQTGLLFIEVLLDGVQCDALVDVGSLYTIANTAATKAVLAVQQQKHHQRHAPKQLTDLLKSGTVAAGIDGQPQALHLLNISSLQLGSNTTISFDTQLSSATSGTVTTTSPAPAHEGVFAAHIPGFAALGVQGSGLILGLDVLSQLQLVLSKECIYVRKINT